METYNGDLTQSLKWLQNKAPNIQSLVGYYQSWRETNNATFWSNWESSVFNIDTANSFGLRVWCTILGVPSNIVDLTPNNYAWAFGVYRKNFKYVEGPFQTIQNFDFTDGILYWNPTTSSADTVPTGVVAANNSLTVLTPSVNSDDGSEDEENPSIVVISDDTSGNSSGKAIQFSEQVSSSVYQQIYQVVPVTSQSYSFSLLSKYSSDAVLMNGKSEFNSIRFYNDDTGTLISTVSINGGAINTNWATTSSTITIPSGTNNLRISICSQLSAGTFSVAEVSMLSTAAVPEVTNPETVGGNFFGTPGALTGTEEVRFLLKLRYAALVSNGRFIFINRMLNWIINKGDKMASPDDNIIVVDNTALSVSNPVTKDDYWEYRIGKNVQIEGAAVSAKLLEVLNNRDYGIVPTIAGVDYLFIQES